MARKRNRVNIEMDAELAEAGKKSRSAKKRDCLALQKLGEELADLSREARQQLNLPADLFDALLELDRIKDREGKRRQRQFIGRLMREHDGSAIAAALESFKDKRNERNANFHKAEKIRQNILKASADELPAILSDLVAKSAVIEKDEAYTELEEIVTGARNEKGAVRHHQTARQLFRKILEILA